MHCLTQLLGVCGERFAAHSLVYPLTRGEDNMAKFNGHKNWNHWNVSLWINNDEGLYNLARQMVRRYKGGGGLKCAAEAFIHYVGSDKTPDGAPYSISSVRAAMRGM